ncbi:(2Fe-2S)-binding protein [Rhodovibrionaceae bacterium A322]
MAQITVNGRQKTVEADPDTPLLWVVRDDLNMTGTKFGCGVGACGACTLHLDGEPVRGCQTTLAEAEGLNITTIEAVTEDPKVGREAEAVQQAWRDLDVVQCGYCQSGQIMQAVGLLKENPKPSDEEIDDYMSGNLCRCATYVRIRAAIHQAAEKLEA